MHTKDFEGWIKVKQKIHAAQREHLPIFNERQVWWCSIGVNVGDEEDGKNALYHRPVLI